MSVHADNLYILCSCLAESAESRAPSAVALLATELRSPKLGWEGVISIAVGYFLLPALWKALKRKGLTHDLPPAVKDFLHEVYVLNTARNEKLKNQAIEIIDTLSQARISSVLLKGGAFLFDATQEDLGDRMMVDIDVLVPEDRLAQSVVILKDLGYDTLGDKKRRPHHYPPLFRHGEVATIEIHWCIGDETKLLPPEHAFDDAIALEAGASKVWIPSPTHRIIHNMFHAAVQDDDFRRGVISLKALHDLARIAEAHRATIDWEQIDRSMRRCGLGRVLETHVYLASRLLKWPRPSAITPTWRAALHYRRCLAFTFIRGATTPAQIASVKNFIRKVTTPDQRDLLRRLANW
jgi:hypothetical protein